MQNASTVIRPRTVRSRSIVPSLPVKLLRQIARPALGDTAYAKTAQRAELSALGELFYKSFTTSWGVPTNREMTEATSSRVITTRTWAFLSARTASIGASIA